MRSQMRKVLPSLVVLAMLTVLFPVTVPEESEAAGLEHTDEYYYNQMSAKDQALYRQIYASAVNFDTDFMSGYDDWNLEPDGTESSDAKRGLYILQAIRFDHPELYYLDGSFTRYGDGKLQLSFNMDKDAYAASMATIATFVEDHPINTITRYTAVNGINDVICDWTDYDLDAEHAHDMSAKDTGWRSSISATSIRSPASACRETPIRRRRKESAIYGIM